MLDVLKSGFGATGPNCHAVATREEALALHQQCVMSHFRQLNAERQGKFLELYSWDKYNDADDNATVWGIFQSNAARLSGRDEGEGGVFMVRWHTQRMICACLR